MIQASALCRYNPYCTQMDSPDGPRISVIIPVHNRPRLVREAVQSVLLQTYRDFEVIAVDDGSTDETPRALADLADGDAAGRVRIRRVPHCGRPGAVRNRGARSARGRYLAFLDSDDLWAPEKLERQLALHAPPEGRIFSDGAADAARLPAPRISHTRERWIRDGRTVSQAGQRHRRSGDLFEASLKKCIIGPSTVLMERSLFEELGGFREDLEVGEDYELWLRLTHHHFVAYLEEALTTKRAGPWDQLSERYGHIEGFRIDALRRLVESRHFADIPSHHEAARLEMARKCAIFAAGRRKRGYEEEATSYEALAELLLHGGA